MATHIAQPYTVLKIATNTGPLAQIWLASNMANISRGSVLQTSIKESAEEIAKVSGCNIENSQSTEYITLRTSGELLHGIVRVYSKQAGFLLSDIKDTLIKISSLFKVNSRINVTISKVNTITKIDQLILEDTVTEKEVLVTPSLDFLDASPSNTGTTLLGTDNSMRRNVQGAAPRDTSLEVGRRFNPDEEFSNNSSGLNLDFDINDQLSSPSKSMNEGTRNTPLDSSLYSKQMMESTMLPIDGSLRNNVNEDDDLLGDEENMDFDLGINEDEHGTNNDLSIEFGRRAEEINVNEPTDFGFNLDIGKDLVEEEQEEDVLELQETTETMPIRRPLAKDPALKHTNVIIQDKETELSNEQMKDSSSIEQENDFVAPTTDIKVSTKRIWNDFMQDLSYLPTGVIDSLFPYRSLKKQRTEIDEQNNAHNGNETEDLHDQQDDMLEPDFNISLGLANISEEENDDVSIANDQMEMNIMDSETNSEANEALIQSDISMDEPLTPDEMQVKLPTGEIVSKAAVSMAEVLRNHSGETPMKFDDVLLAQQTHETPINRKEASRAFFDMLSLATANCIDIKQKESHGDINIITKNAIFEKFITA